MPDITMCTGEGCPEKYTCYRHGAIPDSWQSYFAEVPYDYDKKDCDNFWRIEVQDDKD